MKIYKNNKHRCMRICNKREEREKLTNEISDLDLIFRTSYRSARCFLFFAAAACEPEKLQQFHPLALRSIKAQQSNFFNESSTKIIFSAIPLYLILMNYHGGLFLRFLTLNLSSSIKTFIHLFRYTFLATARESLCIYWSFE